MWDRWAERLVRFLRDEDGPTAVEYAVILALIIIVCTVSISTITQPTNQAFKSDDLRNALITGS